MRRRRVLTLEEPLGSRQPATYRRHERGIEKQVHRDANRRTCRGDLITGLHVRRVSAFPRLNGHVELAGRVGHLAENRQIDGAREALRVCPHQEVEGLLPVAARRRVAPALDNGLTHTSTERSRVSYRRNSLAYASGLRTTSPRANQEDPWRA